MLKIIFQCKENKTKLWCKEKKCMACSQSQAWTHKLAYRHKTIQTSRERAVTNRSKVDKDSVSQLLIVFWSKRKRIKTKCEDHRKKQVKLNDLAEHKRSMHEEMTTKQPCTPAMNQENTKLIRTSYEYQKLIRTSYPSIYCYLMGTKVLDQEIY